MQAQVSGQVAGCHAQLGFRHPPAERIAEDDGGQLGNRRARLLTRQPAQH